MALQQNVNRIQTTHVGSLPRPKSVLDLMKRRVAGESVDEAAWEALVRTEVAAMVQKQVDLGLDIVSDGEVSKPGFFSYVQDRLEGFESRPDVKINWWPKETALFPEYYERYFREAMVGGMVARFAPQVCVGPVRYKDRSALDRDKRGEWFAGEDPWRAHPSTPENIWRKNLKRSASLRRNSRVRSPYPSTASPASSTASAA